jgi:enediyne biosynthesis protein E4
VIWRRSRADGSYASANDSRVLAGLGASVERPRVRVQWPDGQAEEWTDVAIDQYTTLVKGSGR